MNRRWETGISSLQWFVFLLANSLTLPIVIGQAYHLPADEIAGLMQRTFLVVGLSSLLSGWIGHRLPIPDGPAGIWLGVFVLMGEMAASQNTSPSNSLQLLEGGMLLCGTVLVAVGAVRGMNAMLRLFTPLVTGVYLMLLAFQLSGVFLKGMIGVSGAEVHIAPLRVAISLAVFALVLALSIWGRGWMKSYAVLIGICAGWLAFLLAGETAPAQGVAATVRLPVLFAWGRPRLNVGMAVSSILVAFVLLSNIIASVAAMKQVLTKLSPAGGDIPGGRSRPRREESDLNRGGIVGGIGNILSSVLATVGVVPLSIAAGFVGMTGQSRKAPFFYACAALMLISFLPAVYSFLALLPGPVAYAAMLASFAQMIGIGLRSVLQEPLDQRRLTILGVSLIIGTGVMYLPPSLFAGLPTILQYVLGNGLMVGMVVSLVLEHAWRQPKNGENADGGTA
jgi:xanthine/uracil permease